METINLNLIPTGARPVLHASQYDKGRQFRANLFEGPAVYTLTGAETLSISVRKPDGHVVIEGITNTSDSYIIIETTEQMTACAGDSFAEVKIEEGGDLLGTLNLILAVEQSPEAGGDPSESFIYNLETQIAAAVAEQYDSADVIFDAAPTAGHGVGFAVTSEGVLAAIPTDLDDLNDVETTAPAQGEALVWDGTKWVNGTVSTVGNLDDLSDVDTTGKQEGDSLRYNGLEWVAKPTVVEMTQAEYNSIVDFTPYANTHIVITDAPNLNPTASDIEYSSGVSVADELNNKADSTALPKVKYTEINVIFDNTGEGKLFVNSRKLIVGLVDLTSDSNYIGYTPFFDGNHTSVKGFSRTQQAYASTPIVSSTRKVGVYYLDNITIENV